MFNSEIRKARPSLLAVSPLTFWLCIGYVGLNLAIGYVVYTVPDATGLAIYRIFNQQLMGALFALNAFALLGALIFNAWKTIRVCLGFGLFIKSLYAYSLLALGVQIGFKGLNGIISVWLFIVWVQFCVIIFFAPPSLNGKKTHGLTS